MKALLPQAKTYARNHGHSLSQLIENSLREMSHSEDIPFSKRWSGKFKEAAKQTARYKSLGKRYLYSPIPARTPESVLKLLQTPL